MERVLAFILRYRIPILILLIPLSIFFYVKSRQKKVDNSFDIWLDKDDPEIRRYERFLEFFEGDEFIAVGYIGDDIWTPETLNLIHLLSDRLSENEKVLRVASLWTIEDFRGSEEEIEIRPFLDPEDILPERMESLKERALENPFIRGFLLSKGADALLTVAFIPTMRMEELSEFIGEVESMIASPPFEGRFLLVGQTLVGVTMDRESINDEKVFYPVIFSIIFLVLLSLFRNLYLVLISFLMINITLSFIIGISVLLGLKFNMIIGIAPPLFLTITTTFTIHITEHFRSGLLSGLDRRDALRNSIIPLFSPLLFSALTTGAGFLSFLIGDIKAVRTAGIFIGAGMVGIFLLTFGLMPVFLSFIRTPRHRQTIEHEGMKDRGDFEKVNRLSLFVGKNRWGITGIAAIIALISVWGALKLRAETSTLLFFKKSHPLRQAYERFDEKSLGFSSVEVFIEGRDGARLDDREMMERLLEIERFAESDPYVVKVFGPQTYLKEMKRLLEGVEGGREVPDTDEKVRQFLFLYELAGGEDLFSVLTPDKTKARLSLIMKNMTSERAERFKKRLEVFVKNKLGDRVDFSITGIVPLFVEFDVLLLQSQLKSFGLAILFIFILILILLRSLKVALICMIPNLIPITMTLGIMGFFGIPVDMATMMIAGVALGIAVDNTLYFTVWFKRGINMGMKDETAVTWSHNHLQKPIIFSAITLFSGFLVLSVGTFKPTITFGVMSSITMLFACIGDLLLLPSLFLIFKPFDKSRRTL